MDKIYLDACCLNRPFDDQTRDRIRLESEAVLLILKNLEKGHAQWIGSNMLEFEVQRIPDMERRRRILEMLKGVALTIISDGKDLERARELQSLGFKAADSLHIACAEKAKCDILLTTDDRMLRAAKRNADQLQVHLANPVDWIREVKPA